MRSRSKNAISLVVDDPQWYKDAIIYETHVRAFFDSNADGIGDLRGLVEKLDYLQDLGVTALWLLPFYPSPLRDDGYDIADYVNINPMYGNLADLKLLLREAHRRGMRVITELVINHTSDRHPWFQRARRAAPGSSWRNFYVWNDSPDRYREARIIFSDFEPSNWTWDPVANAYFWHRFYSHQPDLNFDHPPVQQAVIDVLDFWLSLDIDGMRLDAVPYLFERDGTSCENLPETHAFLKRLRHHIDERYPNRMLIAEANQWPEDAVSYFGTGDECHMAFHFPLMPRLFMGIRMEDRFPIIDILQQTPAIPESSQWALFLRNHDELTLEMVTAEDRDYMYRVYAQDSHARINLGIRRRLAPLLENHRGKIELMNGLLFSLPGTPVLYYGDEIGMGDNIYLGDRNGVRTPMQWTPERNAGFSRGNPQRLYLPLIIDPEYHYHTVNVEAQQNNPHSLLWWMKRLIALRKRYQAFGRGSLEFLYPENHKILVFVRKYKNEQVLVVANLSRFVQAAELNLSAYKGLIPVEMLGRTALPAIDERPYLITLAPHAFYWLLLEPAAAPHAVTSSTQTELRELQVAGAWSDVFSDPTRSLLEGILLNYIPVQPWFVPGGEPSSARIVDCLPIASDAETAYLALVQIEYSEGEAKTFVVPISFRPDSTDAAKKDAPGTPAICRLVASAETAPQAGVLCEAVGDQRVAQALLQACARHRRFHGSPGELIARTTRRSHRLRDFDPARMEPAFLKGDPGNTLIAFGDQLLLKLYRDVATGVHPEVEMGVALADKTSFTQATRVAGTLEYRNDTTATTLATLFAFVPNQGDAWQYTLDALGRFFEQVLTHIEHAGDPQTPAQPLVALASQDLPSQAREWIGTYLETARRMGQLTSELHAALASITDDPAFTPEASSVLDQRSSYQTSRTWAYRVFQLLRHSLQDLPEKTLPDARRLLGREADLIGHLRHLLSRRVYVKRIRCHGDLHLGSLLNTGKDFVVIDFEGEALRPLSDRRHKRMPIHDVASLIYSLDWAVRTALEQGHLRDEDRGILAPWARFWHTWVSATYIKAYLEAANVAPLLPHTPDDMQLLLDYCLLGRGIFELRHQLLHRLDHVHVPLQIMLRLLEAQDRRPEPVLDGAAAASFVAAQPNGQK